MNKKEMQADHNKAGEQMEALYLQEYNRANELQARVTSLEYMLELAKPAIIFAKENPDVVPVMIQLRA